MGIVLAGSLTGAWLFCHNSADNLYISAGMPILGLGLLLAGVGLWDDIRPLSARIRAGTQLLTCLGALIATDTLSFTSNHFSSSSFHLLEQTSGVGELIAFALLLLAAVWWINLFNFMDGIDGLAGTQALFMFLAAGGLSAWMHPEIIANPIWLWGAAITGATLVFTLLNWAPASIFMGDVGSTWLAFIIFSLALLSTQAGWATYPMWLILAAAFITDATTTLFTRIIQGERWHTAHRSHVYQKLARRWQSHQTATLLVIAINLLWLLPLATACLFWPAWNLVWLSCAYLPLIIGALKLDAGKTW